MDVSKHHCLPPPFPCIHLLPHSFFNHNFQGLLSFLQLFIILFFGHNYAYQHLYIWCIHIFHSIPHINTVYLPSQSVLVYCPDCPQICLCAVYPIKFDSTPHQLLNVVLPSLLHPPPALASLLVLHILWGITNFSSFFLLYSHSQCRQYSLPFHMLNILFYLQSFLSLTCS